MTNIMEYRAVLCKEFIQNEEDYISRSENIASLKKARKEKEKEEERRRKNVSFFMAIGYVIVMLIAIGSIFGIMINIIMPKNIEYYESKYVITYQTHIVEEGETLTDISKDILRAHPEIINKVGRWYYDDLLVEVNNLDNPNKIYPGQEIIYPVF